MERNKSRGTFLSQSARPRHSLQFAHKCKNPHTDTGGSPQAALCAEVESCYSVSRDSVFTTRATAGPINTTHKLASAYTITHQHKRKPNKMK